MKQNYHIYIKAILEGVATTFADTENIIEGGKGNNMTTEDRILFFIFPFISPFRAIFKSALQKDYQVLSVSTSTILNIN